MNTINFEIMPDNIRKFIEHEKLIVNDIGESISKVIHIPHKHAYLKIYPKTISFVAENELLTLKWLKNKLPVPEIIEHAIANDIYFLLITEIDGYGINNVGKENANDAIRIFADTLRLIHSIDITDCPKIYTTDDLITKIEYCIRNKLYGSSEYADNDETYKKLELYRKKAPDFDPVFIHGDYAMVNILTKGNKLKGIIDVGESGVYCKYRDLVHALDNIKYWGFTEDKYEKMFLEIYGLKKIDIEKIEFYSELDYD